MADAVTWVSLRVSTASLLLPAFNEHTSWGRSFQVMQTACFSSRVCPDFDIHQWSRLQQNPWISSGYFLFPSFPLHLIEILLQGINICPFSPNYFDSINLYHYGFILLYGL